MYKVIAPLNVWIEKSKGNFENHIINLNKYRNWHFITSNKIKIAYKDELFEQLNGRKFKTPIRLKFEYFKGSNRKCDRANVYSIHEKFFCDALVQYKCIKDDSDEYIEDSAYKKTKIDKDNPRMEITIN